jgi:hypothetical protein
LASSKKGRFDGKNDGEKAYFVDTELSARDVIERGQHSGDFACVDPPAFLAADP